MPATSYLRKSGLVAAFFVLQSMSASAIAVPHYEPATQNEIAQLKVDAVAKKLHQSPEWNGLLHANKGQSNIADNNFLLSLPTFSSAKELQKTIDFLYQGTPSQVCRFPARYLWLRQHLNAPELPLDACPEVIEFRQKAPIDEIKLVFASEMVAQPASMLGHAFLKFSGQNEQGQEVSHAISFYTDTNTYNLPKLLFDSMIIGMKGYFSLSDYNEKLQRYVDEEQRNLWEYQLSLSKFQKELIQLHILELKQTNLTYFFHKYNCATLLNFILTLSGKSISDSGWSMTPKDVIKNAQQAGLIIDTRVTTPSRWLYRALATQVPVMDQRTIRQHVRQGDIAEHLNISGSKSSFIRVELAHVYNQHAYLTGDLNKTIWLANDHAITAVKAQFYSNMTLSTGNTYNPINSPEDSQVSLSTQYDGAKASVAFTVLPASHTLNDDNRSYSSESSLQLFATTLTFPLNGEQPTLERITFFDMQSLVPYDEFTGGASTRFHIAVEPQKNSLLENSRVLVISGAYGLTKRVEEDVDLYSLGGGGVSFTGLNEYGYTTIEAGAVIREVWNMKSLLTLTRTDNQVDRNSHYYSVWLSQSKYLDKSNTLNMDFKCDFNNSYNKKIIALTLKRVF